MAALVEGSDWENEIYRLETDDPVLGGEEGIDNLQAKQLGSRTQWLKNAVNERITSIAAAALVEQRAPWSVLDQVITAGGLAPDHAVSTQLRDAINNLVKGPADKIVRVASTAAINLAAPGANIDGTAMVAGDTFLEKDNATLANRGIYVWNGAAVPATRDPSADNGAELFGGMIIRVKEGTTNADTNWQITNDGTVTIGTTGLTFVQIGNLTGSLRNKIINGNFVINQRVVAGVVTLAAGVYGHDRWKAGSGGCTYSFVQSEGITTLTITNGSLVQVVEGINIVSGEYILSWGGTAQGKVNAGAFSAGGINFNANYGANVTIEFGVGTLSLVQMELYRKTPFEHRAYEQEMLLCQRYFEKSYDDNIAPGTGGYITHGATFYAVTTADIVGNNTFKVRKRAVPTIVVYSPSTGAAGQIRNNTSSTIVTSGPVGDISQYGFNRIGMVVTFGHHFSCHWTASSEL
jgi:hypothetical protein